MKYLPTPLAIAIGSLIIVSLDLNIDGNEVFLVLSSIKELPYYIKRYNVVIWTTLSKISCLNTVQDCVYLSKQSPRISIKKLHLAIVETSLLTF